MQVAARHLPWLLGATLAVAHAGCFGKGFDLDHRDAAVLASTGGASGGNGGRSADVGLGSGGAGTGGAVDAALGTGGTMSSGGSVATGGALAPGTGGALLGSGGDVSSGGTIGPGTGGSSTTAPTPYTVAGVVRGAPASTVIAANSATVGASCASGSCQVPQGGTATLEAPDVANYFFAGWSGAAACTSASRTLTLANVTSDVSCTATYQEFCTVTVTVVGGPAGTMITPTSSTPGSTCAAGGCQVPSGGTVTVTAVNLTNWAFRAWTGAETSWEPTVVLSRITSNTSITATYINQDQVDCLDQPPANAVTTSTPQVTITYTTAAGWTTAALCPWSCKPDYCVSGGGCAATYLDRISFTSGDFSMWYGGDDRSDIGPRSVGAGQGVTPTTNVTMDRFGFELRGGFRYDTTSALGTQPITLELDLRNASGVVQTSYTVSLPADFSGGWVFWSTPSVALSPGVQYIFTSFMPSALTQPVSSGILGDAEAGYTGGTAYAAESTSASQDMKAWTLWYDNGGDFRFRVQQRNPACP